MKAVEVSNLVLKPVHILCCAHKWCEVIFADMSMILEFPANRDFRLVFTLQEDQLYGRAILVLPPPRMNTMQRYWLMLLSGSYSNRNPEDSRCDYLRARVKNGDGLQPHDDWQIYTRKDIIFGSPEDAACFLSGKGTTSTATPQWSIDDTLLKDLPDPGIVYMLPNGSHLAILQ